MLNIIEGANYVGKTTTLDVLKKARKSFIYIYHPRFNNTEFFEFDYYDKVSKKQVHVHRDIVYQVSHMTCLKYLESFKDKNILLDRCFMSEMVYNEYYDRKIYNEFMRVLKEKFEYKLYYLTVDNDEKLRERVKQRVVADKEKKFGVRMDAVKDIAVDDTVENKMKVQRELDQRYRRLIVEHNINAMVIDTSDIVQKEVAKKILEDIK